jgi:hypothetical protein
MRSSLEISERVRPEVDKSGLGYDVGGVCRNQATPQMLEIV